MSELAAELVADPRWRDLAEAFEERIHRIQAVPGVDLGSLSRYQLRLSPGGTEVWFGPFPEKRGGEVWAHGRTPDALAVCVLEILTPETSPR